MTQIPAIAHDLSRSKFFFAAFVMLFAQFGLAQDEPKLNELQSYVRNLDSVKSYVCRAYFFRFGTEQFKTDGVLHSYSFVSSKVYDLVADLNNDTQLLFENTCLERNADSTEITTVLLKLKSRLFERSEMKEAAQRDSSLILGPFNPLTVGMGRFGDLMYYAKPESFEKSFGLIAPHVELDGRSFGSYGSYLVFKADSNSGPFRANFDDVRVTTTYKTIDGIVLPSRAYLEGKREGLWIELDWVSVNGSLPTNLFDVERVRRALSGKGVEQSDLEKLGEAFSYWLSSANRPHSIPTSMDHDSSLVKACSPILNYRNLMCSLGSTGSANAFEQYGQLRKTSSLDLAKDYEQLRDGSYEKLGPFVDECIRHANIHDGPFEDMFHKDVEGRECETILFRYLRKHGPAGLLHPECITRLAITEEQQKSLAERINNIRIFQRLLWSGKIPNVSAESILSSCSKLNQFALIEDLLNEDQRKQFINLIKLSNDRQNYFSLAL